MKRCCRSRQSKIHWFPRINIARECKGCIVSRCRVCHCPCLFCWSGQVSSYEQFSDRSQVSQVTLDCCGDSKIKRPKHITIPWKFSSKRASGWGCVSFHFGTGHPVKNMEALMLVLSAESWLPEHCKSTWNYNCHFCVDEKQSPYCHRNICIT